MYCQGVFDEAIFYFDIFVVKLRRSDKNRFKTVLCTKTKLI